MKTKTLIIFGVILGVFAFYGTTYAEITFVQDRPLVSELPATVDINIDTGSHLGIFGPSGNLLQFFSAPSPFSYESNTYGDVTILECLSVVSGDCESLYNTGYENSEGNTLTVSQNYFVFAQPIQPPENTVSSSTGPVSQETDQMLFYFFTLATFVVSYWFFSNIFKPFIT